MHGLVVAAPPYEQKVLGSIPGVRGETRRGRQDRKNRLNTHGEGENAQTARKSKEETGQKRRGKKQKYGKPIEVMMANAGEQPGRVKKKQVRRGAPAHRDKHAHNTKATL